MQLKLKPLSQQTIVVTGATSGIGLCTARMAAHRGANVVVVARNEEALIDLVHEITAAGFERKLGHKKAQEAQEEQRTTPDVG